jgi:hypothetical protein
MILAKKPNDRAIASRGDRMPRGNAGNGDPDQQVTGPTTILTMAQISYFQPAALAPQWQQTAAGGDA